MKSDAEKKILREFYVLTRIPPVYKSSILEEALARGSYTFDLLAEKVFDHPRLLVILTHKLKDWLKAGRSEVVFSLAGYIHYLKEDYKHAQEFFLKAINSNPVNLDNWFDLAFSLYHQTDAKNALAKKIFFNFDFCANVLSKKNKKITLAVLKDALDRLK